MAQRNGHLILHKFYQYLGPSIILVFAMQFGSLAAGIIIGQFLGADFLTAASLSVCIVIITELPGLAIPVGLSIVLGQLFSQRKFLEAKKTFNSVLFFGLILNLLYIPIGIFLTPNIASFLAGNFTGYIPIIEDYLSVFFYFAPFFYISIIFCNLLAADNHPQLAGLYFLISSVVHVLVEILFCLYLPHEHIMFFVALSFEIGLLAGFILLIPYLRSKSRLLKFGPTKISFSSILPVLRASLTTFLSFGLQFVMSFLLMKTASTAFKSEEEMNTYTIMANLVMVMDLFTTSIIQMLPAIVSSLYGEKDYSGIKFVVKRVMILSFLSLGVLLAITLAYPRLYLLVFGINLASVSGNYDFVIRIYSICFVFYMLNRFIQTYYPSISANLPSIVNTILERGIAGIPLTVCLMLLMSVNGYSLGMVLSESLSVILTIAFLLFYRKKKGASSILLLPKSDPNSPKFEMSVSRKDEVEEASAFIKEKAMEIGASERTATYLSLGTEELLMNDFEYGYSKNKKDWGVDLILTKDKDSFILSLKDDGIPFDPIARHEDDGPEAIFHGLPLIKKVASRLEYVRIINLNETIMEMDERPSESF